MKELKKKYYCKELDCNNEISLSNFLKGKGRCSSCANRITSTIHGETLKKHYCIDCDLELSTYNVKRCRSCAMKYRFINNKEFRIKTLKRITAQKISLTKQFLYNAYIVNNKSANKIAKEVGCSASVIGRLLIQNQIKIRTHNNVKHGGYLKKYHCKDCGKKISTHSGFYGQGRCLSCAKYIDGRTLKVYYCIICGTEIKYKGWKYGTKLCASCAMRKRCKNPQNHPRWQGGIGKQPYPFEFDEILKEQMRQRDNHQCQICGIKQENYYRKLDVHHIDYDKENLNPDNLISLCLSCHMKTNANREHWMAYFKEYKYGTV